MEIVWTLLLLYPFPVTIYGNFRAGWWTFRPSPPPVEKKVKKYNCDAISDEYKSERKYVLNFGGKWKDIVRRWRSGCSRSKLRKVGDGAIVNSGKLCFRELILGMTTFLLVFVCGATRASKGKRCACDTNPEASVANRSRHRMRKQAARWFALAR